MTPWIKTEFGFMAYRCRYSLNETRKEFAKRFLVNDITIFNWERGKTLYMPPIHKHLLKTLNDKLMAEGRLVPLESINGKYSNAQPVSVA